MAILHSFAVTGPNRPLPDTVRHIGRAGASFDAYAVDFNGVRLIALHDRRGQLIAMFVPEDQVDLSRPGEVEDLPKQA